jgi:hypothetical protein
MRPFKVYLMLITLVVLCGVFAADQNRMTAGDGIKYVDTNKVIRKQTSIISILADPQRFHGKEVVIVGYVGADRDMANVSYSDIPLREGVAADWIYIDYSEYKNKSEFLAKSVGKWCGLVGVINANRGGPADMEYSACTIKISDLFRTTPPR